MCNRHSSFPPHPLDRVTSPVVPVRAILAVVVIVPSHRDFGTNLFEGPYANTHFAGTCRKALETGRTTFSDLEYYAASNGRAAGFMASVIVDEDGEKLGLLAIHIRLETIDNVMAQKTGHRATYLIGSSPGRGVTLRSTLLDTNKVH